jgi:hypothetical protein
MSQARIGHAGCIDDAEVDEQRTERAPDEAPIAGTAGAEASGGTALTDPSVVSSASATPMIAERTTVVPLEHGRSWRTTLGIGLAIVLAFAWGALAYRELSPVRSLASAPVTVAGVQAPPGWINEFADAFCAGNADKVVALVGPPLAGQGPQIAEALATREWSCSDTRFLGSGLNTKGSFYVWVTIDDDRHEQWWVFTVIDDQVIGID